VIGPDERTLQDHLARGRFQAGVAADRWRLIGVAWPYALIAVSAADRPDSPREFVIRFELTGYPHAAPTGGLWDIELDDSLPGDRRPKGERVAMLFRTDGWTGGATAMYAAWDRIGLEAHPDWAQNHPLEAWNPSREISFILSRLHEVLNADDYVGV
jgi:hypothetical protein